MRSARAGATASEVASSWTRVWPLVGRDEQLEALVAARGRAAQRPAVLLAGPQGVGKSRLADESLARARDERWGTDRVDGAAATAAIPLGAVAHLAPAEAVRSGDPLRVLLAIVEQLRARAARRPLMVVVDDAHELDEASLAVLRRALSIPHLFVLMTVRSDVVLPPPLVTLWKDGLADRIDLGPLSRDETYALVAGALGGDVETATLRWLWDHSLGNPLFLRELVLAERSATDTADWQCVDGVWARTPGRPLGRRLAEVVRGRLSALDEAQRGVLEVLTVSGPLPLDQLGRMVSLDAVADVADRGLVTTRNLGSGAGSSGGPGVVVSLAHPLYGKVLSDGFTAVRGQALRRQLLDVLVAGAESPSESGDLARIAGLQLDLGLEVDTRMLVLAANLVLAAYPRTLAERLALPKSEIDADPGAGDFGAAAALAEASARPAAEAGDDIRIAGRLARTAWERDRTLTSGLAWVAVLVATGRADEGRQVTDELEALVSSEWDRTYVALARAELEFWVQGEAETAVATLSAAEAAVTEPAALRRLRNIRAGIALNIGRVEEAAQLADEVVADAFGGPEALSAPTGDEDPAGLMGVATSAASHALAGRPRHAAEMVDRSLPAAAAHVGEAPEVMGQLMLARHFAARMLGAIDEAEWITYACHQAGVEHGSLDAVALFTGALGMVTLDRGQATAAARRLRESEVLLRDRDMFGYRPWVLACLSASLAQLGQAEAAQATYGLVRAAATRPRFFDPDVALAEAWCHAAAGRLREATDRAADAAATAQRAGVLSFEATALHTLVRLGHAHPPATAGRLHELAEAADSPLWRAFASHASASAAEDAAALAAVSATFEEMGLLLLAAEAAAEAAAVHVRRGDQAAAYRSTSRAEALAARCDGARTPALRLHGGVPTLTAREKEVAALVADGLTSKAIAEILVLSPRTVESHLYRIFTKLGVSDRTELAALLDATPS